MPRYPTAQEIVDQTEAAIAELQPINTHVGFCMLHGFYEEEYEKSARALNIGMVFGLCVRANDERRADIQYYRSNFNIH